MRYLLDTAAISEAVKPRPNPHYLRWVEAQFEDDLALSVLTVGEVRRGIIRTGPSRRGAALERWLSEDVLERFQDRLLPVDYPVSVAWADIIEDARTQGFSLPIVDSLIAATAIAHDLAVVTRNVADFGRCGVPVVSPWAASD